MTTNLDEIPLPELINMCDEAYLSKRPDQLIYLYGFFFHPREIIPENEAHIIPHDAIILRHINESWAMPLIDNAKVDASKRPSEIVDKILRNYDWWDDAEERKFYKDAYIALTTTNPLTDLSLEFYISRKIPRIRRIEDLNVGEKFFIQDTALRSITIPQYVCEFMGKTLSGYLKFKKILIRRLMWRERGENMQERLRFVILDKKWAFPKWQLYDANVDVKPDPYVYFSLRKNGEFVDYATSAPVYIYPYIDIDAEITQQHVQLERVHHNAYNERQNRGTAQNRVTAFPTNRPEFTDFMPNIKSYLPPPQETVPLLPPPPPTRKWYQFWGGKKSKRARRTKFIRKKMMTRKSKRKNGRKSYKKSK